MECIDRMRETLSYPSFAYHFPRPNVQVNLLAAHAQVVDDLTYCLLALADLGSLCSPKASEAKSVFRTAAPRVDLKAETNSNVTYSRILEVIKVLLLDPTCAQTVPPNIPPLLLLRIVSTFPTPQKLAANCAMAPHRRLNMPGHSVSAEAMTAEQLHG